MLKKLAKTTLTTASILAGAALSAASPSHAYGSADSDLLTHSPSEVTQVGVNSSGTAYEASGLMDIAAEVNVDVDAGIAAHVKSWKTWFKVRTENSSWVDFSNDGVSKSYPVFQRPPKVDVDVPLAIPHMTLAPVMVSYCNALADRLRDQGKPNAEIFSQDRTIPVAIRSVVSAKLIPDYDVLQEADDAEFSDWPKFNLICKGRAPTAPIHTADHFQPPPVDFRVKDIKLFLTTFSGANTQPNPATNCKKGQIKVRLTASKAGNAKFKLWTKVGGATTSKVIDAWASHDGNGSFKAEHTEWVSVASPTYVQAKAEEMVSGFGSSTNWKDIMLQCTSPGGGGLATQNPDPVNPDDIPQAKNVNGDFAFVDHGSPKCTRQGKALITLRSPKPDNIHWSLDCKFDNHSGVAPTVPHPDGGYAAAALVAFDVKKTYTEACTLRTVAPYGPEDHVSKHHLYQCVISSGHSASNDVQVPTGTSGYPFPPWQCVDGYPRQSGCTCPPHKKLIYTQVNYHGHLYNGSKCVLSGPGDKTSTPSTPTTGTGVQSVDGLVKTNSDAVRRRVKAAKDAAAAKRKREETVVKARKLKAAQDAAIAKRKLEAKKKAAAAAAVRARMLKARQEAARKAAAAALAKRNAAAAIARRNAAAAIARRNAAAAIAKRNATLKKRAKPRSVGKATQMRVIRRR